MDGEKSHLEMAVELDRMERGVTSQEADLLERVLPVLRKRKMLSGKDLAALERMHTKYFGEKEEEDVGLPEEPDEEEIDDEDLS